MAKIQLESPNASPTKHYRKLDHGDIWHRSNPMVPIFSGESIESTEWTPRYKERRCSSSPCAQNSKFTRRVQSKIRQAKNTVLVSMEIGWKCEASKALNWDNAKVSWRGCRKKHAGKTWFTLPSWPISRRLLLFDAVKRRFFLGEACSLKDTEHCTGLCDIKWKCSTSNGFCSSIMSLLLTRVFCSLSLTSIS